MNSNIDTLMFAGIFSFVIALLLAPIVIKIVRKLKLGQVVLHYVKQHDQKMGVGTMGGIIFIIPTIISSLIFGYSNMTLVVVITVLSYMVLGFLDDFIKIKFKHNEGLKPYQKIIGQLGIAIIIALYCYYSVDIGSEIYIPIFGIMVDFGIWYIPFTIFVYVALTNAVNLTDGLDGLAGGTGAVFAIFTVIISVMFMLENKASGDVLQFEKNYRLAIFGISLVGSLLAYLMFNSHKASIFMGDTGSLALGGALASIVVFSNNSFIILLLGIMYIVSCISVIIQVVSYKLRRKRVFLMSPYHHHLEMKGYNESKITCAYIVITFIMGLLSILAM